VLVSQGYGGAIDGGREVLDVKRLLPEISRAGERAVPGAGVLFLVLGLLATYLTIAPVWAPRVLWWRYDNARLLEIALLVCVGVMAALPMISRLLYQSWMALGRLPRGLFFVFFAFGALSVAASNLPQVGSLQLSLVLLVVCAALVIAALVRNVGAQAEQVLSISVCAGALLVVLQFWAAQAIHLVQSDAFQWHSPFLEFANVRFFSQYQSYTLLLILLPLLLFKCSRLSSLALFVLAANFWALQWMVGTRAVWAGFAVAVTVVLVFGRGYRKTWLKHQAIAVLGGLLIFAAFTGVLMPKADAPPIPKIHSVTERGWQSVNARVTMIRGALAMIQARPGLGVGPGQFGHNYSATLAAHPHNSALQFLSEYGLIAGGAAVALLAMLGLHAIGAIRSSPVPATGAGAVSLYVAAALIMGLVDALFSGNLTMPHSQIMFSVVAGWLLGRSRMSMKSTAPVNRAARAQSFAVSATVLLAAAIALVLSVEYASAIHHMPWWQNPNPPNLWQYGRFTAW
jgi:O-antigen ligase